MAALAAGAVRSRVGGASLKMSSSADELHAQCHFVIPRSNNAGFSNRDRVFPKHQSRDIFIIIKLSEYQVPGFTSA
jgi:hypothetical protein